MIFQEKNDKIKYIIRLKTKKNAYNSILSSQNISDTIYDDEYI